jgi:hypothetical protein
MVANIKRGQAMTDHLTVSEAARRWGVPPRVISDYFYARRLDDRRCPIVGGRRLIPTDYLPSIEVVLRQAGHLPASREEVACG